jgi:hypothetical protein
MDGQIIVASNVVTSADTGLQNFPEITSVTMVSLQFPLPGSHTFEVQESDDTGRCSGPTARTDVGAQSNTSNNPSTRTLIVREF